MSDTLKQLLIQFAFVLPLFLAIWIVGMHHRKQRARSKLPFDGLRRRPAGESLRARIEGFDEKINETILWLWVVPLVTGVIVGAKPMPAASGWFLFLIACVWVGIWAWKLSKTYKQRCNYLLGFDGERYVAEELSILIADGFEVFHDAQFDGFNVDHMLVGKRGVFVVETKTRRKPVDEGRKKWEVEFDGAVLHWPMGPDAHGIAQAQNNASTVSQWLSKAVGEHVPVHAILTLPGWWVHRKAPCSGVDILNPKEIAKRCASSKETLSDNLVKRVVYQLEQKCALELT